MKRVSIFLFLVIATFTGYYILNYNNYSIYNITDATTEQKIVLKTNKDIVDIDGIELKIIGNIDGEASLYVIESDKIYKVIYLKNNVNIDFKSEWYNNSVTLLYDPYNVKDAGKLKIYYQFQ